MLEISRYVHPGQHILVILTALPRSHACGQSSESLQLPMSPANPHFPLKILIPRIIIHLPTVHQAIMTHFGLILSDVPRGSDTGTEATNTDCCHLFVW